MTNETTGQDVQQAQFRAFTPATETGQRYNVQLTLQGETAGKLIAAVQQFAATLDAGGWTPAYGFEGPNGQGRAHTNGNGHAAPAAAQSGGGATGDAAGVTDAEWITVNVPKDGKIRVEFWRTGREYAEENVVRTAEALAPLLESIGLSTAPGEHKPLPVRVHWTRGRERQNKDGTPSGKYYHDVTRLELLPPA